MLYFCLHFKYHAAVNPAFTCLRITDVFIDVCMIFVQYGESAGPEDVSCRGTPREEWVRSPRRRAPSWTGSDVAPCAGAGLCTRVTTSCRWTAPAWSSAPWPRRRSCSPAPVSTSRWRSSPTTRRGWPSRAQSKVLPPGQRSKVRGWKCRPAVFLYNITPSSCITV